MTQKEDYNLIFSAIEKINDEIWGKEPYWEYRCFCPTISCDFIPKGTRYSTLGHIKLFVNVQGHKIEIFDSDFDDRRYNELNDKYESWYKYIRRKWKIIRESFYNITL